MAQNRRKVEAARVANTSPSLPLDGYVSAYADSMYGEIRVQKEADRLAAASAQQADLEALDAVARAHDLSVDAVYKVKQRVRARLSASIRRQVDEEDLRRRSV